MTACLWALIAMSAPWASVAVTALHVVLDDHHSEAAADHVDFDHAAAALHGHSHENGTPAHGHEATVALAPGQLPAPSLNTYPPLMPLDAVLSNVAVAFGRFDPSLPQRVPIILRI